MRAEMSPRSSARIVSYDLRPAKQCERRMMVDAFLAAMEAGFAVPSYRYVGMGANRFYDFIMIHKYLGITNMISLEHDDEMYVRAVFNRPYDFISVQQRSVNDFLLREGHTRNSIYWFDYDGSIHPGIVQDLNTLAPKVTKGDFVFVTVSGSPPKNMARLKSTERQIEIEELFGDLAGSLSSEDMENASFPVATYTILASCFKKIFSVRPEGSFQPFFSVRYADGTEMVSLGGVFDCEERVGQLMKLLASRMPFLQTGEGGIYKIGRFDYTDKERRLFDLAVTARRRNARALGELKALGFGEQEIARYRDLLRYRPRYVETFV